MPEIVETAIQAFIHDTGGASNKVTEPAATQPGKKKYKRSTRVINRRNINTTTGEMIFKKEGFGVLKEITVVADHEINILIKLDGTQPFGARSEWNDLTAITLYSETVVAKLVDNDYVLNLKSLHFRQGLSVFIWFSTPATISNIFGVYDLCEEY